MLHYMNPLAKRSACCRIPGIISRITLTRSSESILAHGGVTSDSRFVLLYMVSPHCAAMVVTTNSFLVWMQESGLWGRESNPCLTARSVGWFYHILACLSRLKTTVMRERTAYQVDRIDI